MTRTERSSEENERSELSERYEIPPHGTHVVVERSDGVLESGWEVLRATRNRVKVRRVDSPAQAVLTKYVLLDDFKRLNPLPGILDVETFDDLTNVLGRISSLTGESGIYTSDEIARMALQVRQGELDPAALTRAGGLRERVKYLLRNQRDGI